MSKPILYGVDTSGPTRFCLLTVSAIGLEVELRPVDFTKNQHKTAEFKKINPIQTTPVLDDNGVYITDSHAICTYLVQKYGSKEHQELYPTDLQARTMVDQKLFFDTGVLFVKLCKVLVSKNSWGFLKKVIKTCICRAWYSVQVVLQRSQ